MIQPFPQRRDTYLFWDKTLKKAVGIQTTSGIDIRMTKKMAEEIFSHQIFNADEFEVVSYEELMAEKWKEIPEDRFLDPFFYKGKKS